MTVDMQGPLSLLVPRTKAAAASAGEGAAVAADDAGARPLSFADVLAAAQPGGDAGAAVIEPAREEGERPDPSLADASATAALPPWLLPTPASSAPAVRAGGEAAVDTRDRRTGSPVAVGGAGSGATSIAIRAEPAAASVGGDRSASAGLPVDASGTTATTRTADLAESRRDAGGSHVVATPRAGATSAAANDDPLAAIAQALAPPPGSEPRPLPTATPTGNAIAPVKAKRAGDAEAGRDAAADSTLAPATGARAAALVAATGTTPAPVPVAPATPMPDASAHDGPVAGAADVTPPAARAAAAPAPAVAVTPGDGSPLPAREADVVSPAPVAGTDAAPLAASPHAVHAAADPVVIEVARPVGSAAWTEEVTGAVAHAIIVRHGSAQLHLHPESMGPVDVRISISGNEANVQLVAAHATTREALENALPALRDLLGSQGLALGQAAVESRAQQDAPAPPQTPRHETGGGDARSAAIEDAPATVARVLRLLDVFA